MVFLDHSRYDPSLLHPSPHKTTSHLLLNLMSIYNLFVYNPCSLMTAAQMWHGVIHWDVGNQPVAILTKKSDSRD